MKTSFALRLLAIKTLNGRASTKALLSACKNHPKTMEELVGGDYTPSDPPKRSMDTLKIAYDSLGSR